MSLLTVDQDKCSKDGLCVNVCPAGIIFMNKRSGYPQLVPGGEKGCLGCGQCVAVCPHGAMDHARVPLAECQPIEKELSVTHEQAVQFLRSRRSIRVFKDRPVERYTLQRLIEIARYAPTAGNSQSIKWLVVTDKDTIGRFAKFAAAHMRETVKTQPPKTYAHYLPALVAAWDRGIDVVLRSAPALIIAAAPRGNPNGMTDVTLALSYLDLIASSMGLGTCWAGLLYWAMNATGSPFKEEIPLLNTHPFNYPLMVGYTDFQYLRLPERKRPNIQWL